MPETTTRPPLTNSLTVALDIARELDRLGVRAASISASDWDLSHITIHTRTAFDRAIIAAAFDLLNVSRPFGDVTTPMVTNSGTLARIDGEFSVAVHGPASDEKTTAVAS